MEFRHLEHIGVSNEQKRLNIPIKRKGAEEESVFKTQQSVTHVQGRRCARACVCVSERGWGGKITVNSVTLSTFFSRQFAVCSMNVHNARPIFH